MTETSGGLLCFISINISNPTELADSIVTVGNPGIIRCQEMANLPAEYIPQRKVPLTCSNGSLDFILCEVF